MDYGCYFGYDVIMFAGSSFAKARRFLVLGSIL